MPMTQREILVALNEANESMQGATEAMNREKKIRSWQVGLLGLAVTALVVVSLFVWKNTRDLTTSNCEAINSSRQDIAIVVERVLDEIAGPDQEVVVDAFMESVRNDALQLLDC